MVAMTPDGKQPTTPAALVRERLRAVAAAEARKVAEPLSVLQAQMHSIGQHFAAEVAAAGRRTVAGTLDARRAELAQLFDDRKRRETPVCGHDAPMVVCLVVRFE
jgi:hypothetical protein